VRVPGRASPPDPPNVDVVEERIGPDDFAVAVADVTGPQLVVAGPGTGKTEFLVKRAIELVRGGHATPHEIAVLTFSRRAGADLAARIAGGLGPVASGVDVSTFHSFAHRLLEAHGSVATLLTGPEQIRVVSELLATEDPDAWPHNLRAILSSPTFAEEVADFILRCRERMIDANGLSELARARSDWRALPSFLDRYSRHLVEIERIDYGTLLAAAIDCLRQPNVGEAVGRQYLFVLVDEYQDTSPAQARLLDLLTAEHRNITVAGDPYQSIYSFRGAELANMATFADQFGTPERPVRRLVLENSYRVPAEIMEAALRITSGGALPGAAGPVVPAEHAGRVEAYVFDQQSAEAEWIAKEVERLIVEERLSPDSIAVLVRSKRRLLPELSRAMERRRLPHDKPDTRLVDHPGVRAVLDLTRVAALSAIHELPGVTEELDRAMRRVLLGPLFGLPVMTERALLRVRRRTAAPWHAVLESELEGGRGVSALLENPDWATSLTAADGFWKAWTEVEAFKTIALADEHAENRAALASFAQALARQAERDPALTLLDYLRLVDADDFEATPLLSLHQGRGRIVLTTLHQAKGLEFDVVFLADASEAVFPDTRRSRALLQPHLLAGHSDQVTFRLQEEMRLAYTAMTRASRRVIWTTTAAGIDDSGERPSRFLLAAAGVSGAGELSPPPDRGEAPVTVLEVETLLRRVLNEPTASGARRLAAATVLGANDNPWHASRFAGVAEPGPDHGIVVPPIRMSPSQAEAYDLCPRRYAYERRVRIVESTSVYLTFGTLVHAVLERVDRRAIAGMGPAVLSDALEELDRAIEDAGFETPVLALAWKARAAELFERLYGEWPTDSVEPVLVEHPLSLEVDGVVWTGRADRIERCADGSLRIVDYKSGKTAMAIKEAQRSLQLGFYLMAAREDPVVTAHGTPTTAELWYPLTGAKAWRRSLDPNNLDEIRIRMTEAADGIRAERWTPRVGGHCGRCPVRLVCDRWPDGKEAFVE